MVVAIAPWSLVVHPGKKISYDVIRDIKVTNAALGAKLEDEKARSTLKITYEPPSPLSDSDEEDEAPKRSTTQKKEKTEISLCSLTPGSIEQAPLDITFLEDDLIEFEVAGKNSIHLFGNYVDQSPLPTDFPPDDMDFSDEESVDLRDVSSDVEINPAELEGLDDSDDEDRFEEVGEAISAGIKRRHDSDAMDQDASTKLTDSAKKANKKLKSDSGSAVPTSTDASKAETKPESKKDKKEKKKKDKKEKGDGKEAEGISEEKKPSTTLNELPGGLKIKDVKIGTGKQAKAGNTVYMRYIGKLTDGKTFDSNTKGKPFSFRLGNGDVIKGWDQGVVGMQVGGERLLVVPPALAYGKKPNNGIPPNSTLRFELKLVDVK